MTPLDDLGISSENCPVDDSVGRLRRDWNGSSGVDRPFTIEAVADFAPCFCDGGPYLPVRADCTFPLLDSALCDSPCGAVICDELLARWMQAPGASCCWKAASPGSRLSMRRRDPARRSGVPPRVRLLPMSTLPYRDRRGVWMSLVATCCRGGCTRWVRLLSGGFSWTPLVLFPIHVGLAPADTPPGSPGSLRWMPHVLAEAPVSSMSTAAPVRTGRGRLGEPG